MSMPAETERRYASWRRKAETERAGQCPLRAQPDHYCGENRKMEEKEVKKTVALLITISILFGALAFAAAEGETIALMNALEAWADAYSGIAGEGQVMQMEPLNPSDGINSRYIFVSDEWTGVELKVMVRISETEVICWRLPLSKDNVVTAMSALFSHAPTCYVESRKDGEMPETAMYIRGTGNSTTFAKFLVDAKKIVRSACYGKIAAEEPSADPVLSLFPNIRWGMTNEEMVAEYGLAPTHPEVREVSPPLHPTILGREATVAFIYADSEKLTHIAWFDREDSFASIRDQLIETYNMLYGEAKRVDYNRAIAGDYTESDKGDCNCWIFKRTVILFRDDDAKGIFYRIIL